MWCTPRFQTWVERFLRTKAALPLPPAGELGQHPVHHRLGLGLRLAEEADGGADAPLAYLRVVGQVAGVLVLAVDAVALVELGDRLGVVQGHTAALARGHDTPLILI